MPNDQAQIHRLVRLLRAQRWAALASVDASGQALASMIAYVPSADLTSVYLHLSRLAAHTANLLRSGNAALAISESDTGTGDPQQLARISLQGRVLVVERNTEEYAGAKALYLQRLPDAVQLFEFPDFLLFRLDIDSARFVGGFAQARSFSGEELRRAAALNP